MCRRRVDIRKYRTEPVRGIKNVISSTLLSGDVVNIRCSENALNSFVYVGLILPNRVGTPLAALALTCIG